MKNDNKKLNKVLNTGDVLVTAFGAMIGWGWVVSSGNWIQSAGVIGTVIAFFLGGLMVYFVGMVYAELTTAMPESGGAKVFCQKAFGPIGSFICTWAITLSYIGVVCFEACSLPTIIQYIFPNFLKGYLYTVAGFDIYATWLLTAIIFTVLITYINIIGVKVAALLQNVLTITIAIVGIIFVIISTLQGNIENLNGQIFVGKESYSILKNILSVAIVTPFFLFGFDVIPQVAEEINIPFKKLGNLLIFSIILAVGFYGFIVLAVGYGINTNEITISMSESGLVVADAMAKLLNSTIMAKIMIIGGMCGIITSWNSFMIGGSRALMSMASSHMIPNIFSKIHSKYKTPYLALILIGFLSIISLFFGRKMLIWIANSASFACCISYCMVSMAFVKLRKVKPEMERPFKVKNYKLIGFLSILSSGFMGMIYIIPGTGCTLTNQEFIIVSSWTILGIIFMIICKKKYGNKFGK